MNTKHFAAVLFAVLPLFIVGSLFMKDFDVFHTLFRTAPSVARFLNNSSNRIFIYQCLNGQECGGLSDRQDGIVSAYVISQILGVRFGINVNKPCPLDKYLIPNHVNWIIPDRDLKGKTKEYWTRIGRKHNYAELSYENITYKKTKDIIYYRGNINILDFLMKNPLYKQLPWTDGLSRYDAINHIYDRLFKLSIATEKKLNSFLDSLGESKLFCAHIRTGMKQRYPFPTPHPQTVVDFLKKLVETEPSYRIFLATDSQDVSSLFNRTFGSDLSRVPGPIVHVDQARANHLCDGMEKAILDQVVLTKCHTFIMSKSGYSRTAALLRGSDDNLYEVLHHNVTKVKRMDPL